MACILLLAFNLPATRAQTRQLVWSDEFDSPSLDQSVWSFQTGQFNDCVHFSTDRSANTKIVDGKLQLIALKEAYQGYDYTASVIKTKHAAYWRYGRIEASIKLPVTNGFVPAFWLLPEDERYGWWPACGEIDIMEHPTNEVNKIYGTVHTQAYNYFTGSEPRGSTIVINDAGTAFHLYAVEWTPDRIDFFVDNVKYFTFHNEQTGFQTWPFDQPFYIILNMAVGGGWVGNPDANTIFPAVMEVDYVRVYQTFDDFAVNGPDFVMMNEELLAYNAPIVDGIDYEWSVPNLAHITSGQNSPQIEVDWGVFSGNVELLMKSDEGDRLVKFPVEAGNNLLKNGSVEKGAKYWNAAAGNETDAIFAITTGDVYAGERSIYADVRTPGINAWDVQLSQTNLALKAGQSYTVSFRAKSETNSTLTAAIINATNFGLYASKSFQITNTWAPYTFNFSGPANATAMFNIDLGGHTGRYWFDEIQITIPPPENNNQVKNADFSAGESGWNLTTIWPAIASGSIINGEYAVSITTSGNNIWDVHAGQNGFKIENGKLYELSFDAYATAPVEIFPLVGKNSEPWTVYNDQENIRLSTHRKTYSLSFVMNEPTDNNARLGFDMGSSSGNVFFDNVFLSKGQSTTDVSEPDAVSGRPFLLHQNWPNPFNRITTIQFELYQPGFVSLKVYDIQGRLVMTLLEKNIPSGVNQVMWDGSEYPAGLYFCRLSVNGLSEVKRMTLLK